MTELFTVFDVVHKETLLVGKKAAVLLLLIQFTPRNIWNFNMSFDISLVKCRHDLKAISQKKKISQIEKLSYRQKLPF
jgi:hypothetical protein